MGHEDDLKERIAQTILRFEKDRLALAPESVVVDLSPQTVVVTLRGACAPAERQYATNGHGRALLERLYRELFDAVRKDLETLIAQMVGASIRTSQLIIDPASGNGIILFALTAPSPEGAHNSGLDRENPCGKGTDDARVP